MISAAIDTVYPNRIAISLGAVQGPLASSTLGSFTPSRDVDVYVNGTLLAIQSGAYDSVQNRYLMYAASTFDLSGLVQVIHHMPMEPFTGVSGTLPGFAQIAAVSTVADA